MTTYMFLKMLVRLHQFESLNLFKILQINNIFSYIHRFETDFEELSYTLILILYFSVFYSFWYIGIIRSLIKWWNELTKSINSWNLSCVCSQSMQFEHFNECRLRCAAKGDRVTKFIISFLMHGIFKFVQIMTVGFHNKKNYRIKEASI